MTASSADHGRPRYVRAAVVGLVLLVSLLGRADAFAGPGGLAHPTQAADTLTWAVRPTPVPGQPARDNYTIRTAPGAVINDSFRVKVIGDEPITFAVYASDAFVTEAGGFDLLPASEEPVDLGAWVTVSQPTVTVPGNAEIDIPFTINVPVDASPGDHVGGIVTSISTVVPGSENAPVKVDRRLGPRVYLTVDGPTTSAVEVSDLRVSYDGALGPLTSGTATIRYTVTNTGNVRVQAKRSTRVTGLISDRATQDTDLPELLPGSSQHITEHVRGLRAAGRLTAEVAIDPRPAADGELPTPVLPGVHAKASTTVVPWPLVVLFVVVIGGLVLLRRRRHRRVTSPAPSGTPQPPS